jgi:dTDP-4-dehydrorhamnose reductase
MRLLVLGGAGMLGHKLWQLASREVETWATVRQVMPALRAAGLGDPRWTIEGVDARSMPTIDAALDRAEPDAVVNCIGIVKQLAAAKDPVESIAVNALYPHLLARTCADRGVRLVHISTDCVFDGATGGYRESAPPNATDLYGRSKALGEVTGPGALTLRTSIIGRELSGSSGLVEWFLSRRDAAADGFSHAVFSGLTTAALSAVILSVLTRHPDLTGLYHVAAAPIDKYTLLGLLNGAFDAGVTITPQIEPHIDRSLDSGRFRAATGFTPAPWPEMIGALAADPTPYDGLRNGQGDRL